MTTPKKKKAPLFERTIAEELHIQWKNLRRIGDVEELAHTLGLSKPTINKALIYGCAQRQDVVDGINKFFADRLMAERDKALELIELKKQTDKAQQLLKQSA
jgi:hypothetical protein